MLQQGLLAGKSDFWIDLEKNLLGIMIYKKFYSAFTHGPYMRKASEMLYIQP